MKGPGVIGYGAKVSMGCTTGPVGVRVSRIIYIEGDDGAITIDTIPGMTRQDIYQAAIIITDKGRILKNRTGHSNTTLPSFDLVKDAPPPRKKKTGKSKYRSIFDPTEATCDQ